VTAQSLYTNAILIGNTVSFTVSPSTNCTAPQLAPIIAPVSNLTLSCTESAKSVTLSGTGTVGSTITLRNASGAVIATTLVASGGTWSVTPATSYTTGTQTVRVESAIGSNTVIGNTISITVSSASGCGGGGSSTTGPGGGSPYIYQTVITPTIIPTPKPIVIAPARPLTRYEIAHSMERKSLGVKPYWERVKRTQAPTKTFLGTGPKTLNQRTHIVTSKRVQTNDDIITKQSQTKKTFPAPLLGN
jgi:Bacterial Ig domain